MSRDSFHPKAAVKMNDNIKLQIVLNPKESSKHNIIWQIPSVPSLTGSISYQACCNPEKSHFYFIEKAKPHTKRVQEENKCLHFHQSQTILIRMTVWQCKHLLFSRTHSTSTCPLSFRMLHPAPCKDTAQKN